MHFDITGTANAMASITGGGFSVGVGNGGVDISLLREIEVAGMEQCIASITKGGISVGICNSGVIVYFIIMYFDISLLSETFTLRIELICESLSSVTPWPAMIFSRDWMSIGGQFVAATMVGEALSDGLIYSQVFTIGGWMKFVATSMAFLDEGRFSLE